MNFYAHIDNSNRVIGVSMLSGEIHDSNAIEIDSYDQTILNKIWNGSSFEDAPIVPVYCYAILNSDHFVIDLIESENQISDPLYIGIDYIDETLRGKYYDGENFIVYVPPIEEVTIVSPRTFLSRFTRSEISDILSVRTTDASVNEVYEYWTMIAQNVDVDSTQTLSDVQTLVAAGVILSSRVSEILAHFWWDPSTGQYVDPPVV